MELPTSILDLEEPVEKTQDGGYGREERDERVLSSGPPICVNGLWSVRGIEIVGFLGKRGVRVGERLFIRTRGECDSKNTSSPNGHGNVPLLSAPVGMMLIGCQMTRKSGS
jgi:hypothetical protein